MFTGKCACALRRAARISPATASMRCGRLHAPPAATSRRRAVAGDSRQEQQEPWDYHTYHKHFKQIRVSDITQFNLIKYMISRDRIPTRVRVTVKIRISDIN